jgi:hypothetical protein
MEKRKEPRAGVKKGLGIRVRTSAGLQPVQGRRVRPKADLRRVQCTWRRAGP